MLQLGGGAEDAQRVAAQLLQARGAGCGVWGVGRVRMCMEACFLVGWQKMRWVRWRGAGWVPLGVAACLAPARFGWEWIDV